MIKKRLLILISVLICSALILLLTYPYYIKIVSIIKINTEECIFLKKEILSIKEFKTAANPNSLCKNDQHLDCILSTIIYNENEILKSHNQLVNAYNAYLKYNITCK